MVLEALVCSLEFLVFDDGSMSRFCGLGNWLYVSLSDFFQR